MEDERVSGVEISKWKSKLCGCGPATEIIQVYDDVNLFRMDKRKKKCASCLYESYRFFI